MGDCRLARSLDLQVAIRTLALVLLLGKYLDCGVLFSHLLSK